MTRTTLLAGAFLAATAGFAIAQQPMTFDPDQMPSVQGKVAEYSLTPRGDVDGLILADGTEVQLPPHLGTQLVYAVKPGDAVTVRGLKARALPMIRAMSVRNDASGATVTDNGVIGGPGRRAPEQLLTHTGRIKAQLHGPSGEVNGVLLEDGTIVRMPPPEMSQRAAMLAIGSTITVRGDGVEGPLGRVIGAQAIGTDPDRLTELAAPPPRPGHRPRPGPGLAAAPRGPDGAPPPPPGDEAPR